MFERIVYLLLADDEGMNELLLTISIGLQIFGTGKLKIEQFGSTMENQTKVTVVYLIIQLFWFFQSSHIPVVETFLTSQVSVQACWRNNLSINELTNHFLRFFYFLLVVRKWYLT